MGVRGHCNFLVPLIEDLKIEDCTPSQKIRSWVWGYSFWKLQYEIRRESLDHLGFHISGDMICRSVASGRLPCIESDMTYSLRYPKDIHSKFTHPKSSDYKNAYLELLKNCTDIFDIKELAIAMTLAVKREERESFTDDEYTTMKSILSSRPNVIYELATNESRAIGIALWDIWKEENVTKAEARRLLKERLRGLPLGRLSSSREYHYELISRTVKCIMAGEVLGIKG